MIPGDRPHANQIFCGIIRSSILSTSSEHLMSDVIRNGQQIVSPRPYATAATVTCYTVVYILHMLDDFYLYNPQQIPCRRVCTWQWTGQVNSTRFQLFQQFNVSSQYSIELPLGEDICFKNSILGLKLLTQFLSNLSFLWFKALFQLV